MTTRRGDEAARWVDEATAGGRFEAIPGGAAPAGGEPAFDPVAVAGVLADRRVARGVRLWARSKVWRGEDGGSGGGMAVYGLGSYATTSRIRAARFGEVREVSRDELPASPLRFASVNDFQIWYGQSLRPLGISDKLEVGRRYPDLADFVRALAPDADGMQVGSGADAILVRWG